jgi:peptidoglycan hydrolase-like protein with peptidoglycan-binding domain
MLNRSTTVSHHRAVVERYGRGNQMRTSRQRVMLVVGSIALSLGAVVVPSTVGLAGSAPQSLSARATAIVGLQQGSRGDAVRSLQQALVSAGITPAGGVDGIFGVGTAAAVKQFQSARGLNATGMVDEATAAALAGTGGSSAPTSPLFGLKIGARGEAVRQLQATLVARGYKTTGDADGAFGVNTVNALTSFQYAQRIKVTARVDEATLAALGTPAPVPAAQPAPAASGGALGFAAYGERGARVTTLQRALINAGVTVRGGADGIFGSGTAAAVMAFQKAKGLSATGVVNQATAEALALTPGTAPPVVAAPAITLQAFPVQGKCFFGDTWHVSRGNGRLHEGVDIGAAEGKFVYAVADGRITKQYLAGTNQLTGNGLIVRMADGTYFFYAHLQGFAPGIGVGTPVKAGQIIGYVGTTGNSGVPHLHFEVHPKGGAAVNPYPLVKAINGCGTTAPPPQP